MPQSPFLHAALTARPFSNDEVFVVGAGPQGGEFFLPYRAIRDAFAAYGVELRTADRWRNSDVVDFEVHLNAQRQAPSRPAYAYLYEDPLVRPRNADRALLRAYRKCFTWNDELVDGDHILKLEIPNDLAFGAFAPFEARDLFCVMVASNKALLRPDPRSLHTRRVRIARHFESQAPELFSLYGRGWDQPDVQPGAWGRACKRLHEWRQRLWPSRPAFPSWKGPIADKAALLRRTRFAIAFENVRGSRGYITEKLFDCMAQGCVAVYLGTPGATQGIPADCFIDADAFKDDAALLDHLRGIDSQRYLAMQAAMAAYLQSPQAQRFSREHFTRTLVGTIAVDQGLVLLNTASAAAPAP